MPATAVGTFASTKKEMIEFDKNERKRGVEPKKKRMARQKAGTTLPECPMNELKQDGKDERSRARACRQAGHRHIAACGMIDPQMMIIYT